MSGFFSQRFWVAYWGPLFVTGGLATGLLIGLVGSHTAFGWLPTDPVQQLVAGLAALLAITVLAYLLQTLTVSLVRLYEGYWPQFWPFSWLERQGTRHQRRILQAIIKHLEQLPSTEAPSLARDPALVSRYHNFPRDPARVRPTRLGNVLAAAEEHPFQLYRLDGPMWWPRLVLLLPDAFRAQVDASLTPVLVWLNMCTWLLLLSLGGGVTVLVIERPGWVLLIAFVATVLGGLLLALCCYLAALRHAAAYGELVRAAFELYRLDILKQMHIPLPESYLEERRLWAALNEWLYYPVMPWEAGGKTGTRLLDAPFLYEKR